MIVMSTRFPLPADTDWEARRAAMAERISLYTEVPGLRSKAMFLDPDRHEFGAYYVWEDRPSMDSFIGSELYTAALDHFGTPEVIVHDVVAMLESGSVVDPELAARQERPISDSPGSRIAPAPGLGIGSRHIDDDRHPTTAG
jgi:hypothetical protein